MALSCSAVGTRLKPVWLWISCVMETVTVRIVQMKMILTVEKVNMANCSKHSETVLVKEIFVASQK